jgi:tetratricopeptide (TPR) repeat protein
MAGDHEKSFSHNQDLAQYASKIGDLDVAERCYNRAIADAEYLGRIQDEMKCLLNITNAVYYVWGRYEESLSNYAKLLDYYGNINNHVIKAAVLNNIGMIHYKKSEYDQALDKYNQSLEISKRLGDLYTTGLTLNNIGLIHDIRGDYDQAMELYNQSLEVKNWLGDQEGIAWTLNNIAIMHTKKNY